MKTLVFIILTLASFASRSIGAGEDAPLTVERVNIEAESAFTGGMQFGLVRRCLASRNLELVRACLLHPNLQSVMMTEFSEMEPSSYRDQICLLVLRSPWPYDTPEGLPPGFRLPGPVVPAMCVNVFAGRLPAEPLDLADSKIVRRFAVPAYRHELANKFAALIGEPAVEYVPTPDPRSALTAPENTARPPKGAVPPASGPGPGGTAQDYLPWWIAGAVLLAALAGWAALKRRGS